MKPRFDLIQSDRLDPEDEAFSLDIAVYKNFYEAKAFLKTDFVFKYPYSNLIFHPCDKV